jgi:alkylation response protein AidB-like acyl-CoA dehydrogenase
MSPGLDLDSDLDPDLDLDLDFDDGQTAVADAVAQFCADRCSAEVLRKSSAGFPTALWRELASLGVLSAGGPGGDDREAGALEACAAMESLGAGVFPGPLASSYLALHVLPDSEASAVADGALVVSAGIPPLMPWAPMADVFLEIAGESVFRATPSGEITPVEMLGNETWGRVELVRDAAALPGATPGLALYDLTLAAYLAGAGRALIAEASEHARSRRQFGRSIGEFQGVAHPLADCSMQLEAARALAREAAWLFDQGRDEAARVAGAIARVSASSAATESVHVGHQVFGAMGITLEGPAFHITRRIRQLASAPPGLDAARSVVLADLGLAPLTAGEGATA